MAEGIEKILECPICLEQIKNPKMLPCQHSFCLKNCLENLVDGSSSTKNPVLMCPLCREIFDVPINGVSGFPNNYILQNLLEKQIDTITQKSSGCLTFQKVGSRSTCQQSQGKLSRNQQSQPRRMIMFQIKWLIIIQCPIYQTRTGNVGIQSSLD